MKKYIYIIKTSLLTKIQYMGNLVGGFIFYGLIVFIMLQLWQYLYKDGNGVLAGYTLNQMIWYIIMAELLWFSIRSKVVRTEINKDIKSGTIAYNINKPYNYIFYVLSKYIGEVIISFIFNVIIAIILGIVIVGNLNNFNILSIPFIVITFFLGSIIAAFIYILIGLISFWVEENKPFIWIYERLILVLGIIFPIEILPTYLQGIAKWSPVYTVTYAPAKMVVDFSFNRWLEITLFQGIYLFIVALLTFYIYSKGVKRLNVNGG